jgi:ribosomal-protein-alanine N-acetyltransferase
VSDVAIEPMRRRHVRSVVAIEEQVYPRPWTPGLFVSELALGDQRDYLVARVDGKVVGYGGAMYVLPDAHITTVAVDPGCQRRSIGSRLLVHLCRAALDRGATALTLEVRVSNEPARALYHAFGFVPAGARKGYYPPAAGSPGKAEDALVMWAHDIDRPEFTQRLEAIEARLLAPNSLETSSS